MFKNSHKIRFTTNFNTKILMVYTWKLSNAYKLSPLIINTNNIRANNLQEGRLKPKTLHNYDIKLSYQGIQKLNLLERGPNNAYYALTCLKLQNLPLREEDINLNLELSFVQYEISILEQLDQSKLQSFQEDHINLLLPGLTGTVIKINRILRCGTRDDS